MFHMTLDLLSTPGASSALFIFLLCLVVASVTDLQRRRIPNWLTLPACLVGFVLHGALGGTSGLLSSLVSFSIWFVAGFTFYRRIGGIGAGDIKLIMACAALLGALPTLEVAFVSFLLQVLWLISRWIVRGEAMANFRAMGRWFMVLAFPHLRKVHFVAVGTPDRSPHAPFLLIAFIVILLLRRFG